MPSVQIISYMHHIRLEHSSKLRLENKFLNQILWVVNQKAESEMKIKKKVGIINLFEIDFICSLELLVMQYQFFKLNISFKSNNKK